MAEAIHYCSQCGKMITPVEMRTGQAIVTPTVEVCAACTMSLTPQQRAALAQMAGTQVAQPGPAEGQEYDEYQDYEEEEFEDEDLARPPRRPSGRMPARASSRTSAVRRASSRRRSGRLTQMEGEAPGQAKSGAGTAIMAVVAGLLLVGILAFMFSGGEPEKPSTPSTAPPVATGPVVSTPARTVPSRASPAAASGVEEDRAEAGVKPPADKAKEKRLEEIHWLIDPSMGKYPEICRKLDAFLADYPGDQEALTLRTQVDDKYGKMADDFLAVAVEAAEKFAREGDRERGIRGIRTIEARFGDSDWHEKRGRKAIEDAIADLGKPKEARVVAVQPAWAAPEVTMPAQKPSGAKEIGSARAAIRARDFPKARDLLADRDEWRDSDRRHAEELMAVIADAEDGAAELERARGGPWASFLLGLTEAGKKSVSEAKAYLGRESARLRADDFGDDVDRINRLVREADLVDDMVMEELRSSQKVYRFQIGGKRIAGRIQAIEDGVIKLETPTGRPVQIKLGDVPASDLVRKSRLMRHGGVESIQLAAYYFVLGDVAAVEKIAADLTGDDAPGLREDIETLQAATARPVAEIALPDYDGPAAGAALAEADPMAAGLTRGLVGYWKLDENAGTVAVDSSGMGNDGTKKGGEWVDGRLEGAFSCKGNGYIEIPASPSLDHVQEGSYSISCWIKIGARPPEGTGVVLAKPGWHLGLHLGEASFFMQHWWKDGGQVINHIGSYWDAQARAKDTWHQVVCVIDKDRAETRLYVDGSQAGRKAWTKKGVPTHDVYVGSPWRIGIGLPGAQQWSQPLGDSIVDEVRLYSRALDVDEVAMLGDPESARLLAAGSSAEAVLGGLSKGLVAHWTFDKDAADASGRGNDGNKTSGSWADGKFAGALKGYVDVPESESFWLQKLTVSAWVKFDRTIKDMRAGYPSVVNMHSWNDKKGLLFGNLNEQINKLGLRLFSGGQNLDVDMDITETGKWMHVAGTYDGRFLRIYKDGVEVNSLEAAGKKLDYDRRRLAIGGGFEGLIDDVRIYDRALSDLEVAALVDTKTAARLAAKSRARRAAGPMIVEVEAPPEGWPKEPLPGETGRPGEWAPGVITEIFSGSDFKKRIAVRIDPRISYDWGDAGAGLGLSADNFAVRWTGWLLLPHDGFYTFEGWGDDDLKVYLHGKLLISNQNQKNGPRRYLAGLYPILAQFKEGTGGARCEFKWSGKEIGPGLIPAAYFFHKVPEPGLYGPPAKLMRGLWAEYYRDEHFRMKVAEAPVSSFNFSIGKLAPHPSCRDSGYGIRMRGYVFIRKSTEHTVTIKDIDADGGVRMQIGGRIVLDTMARRGEKIEEKTRLESGFQEFVCEYVGGGAESKLHVIYRGDKHGRDDYEDFVFQDARALTLVRREGFAPGMLRQFFAGPKAGRGRPLAKTLAPAAYAQWRKMPPAPDVPEDTYSAVWRGFVMAPKSGKYLFRAELKSSAFITVGGRKVIMCGRDPGGTAGYVGVVPLRAGPAPIEIVYSETNGDPGMIVYWAGPTFGFHRLAGGALAHKAKEIKMAALLSDEEAAPPPPPELAVVTRADGRVTVVTKKAKKKERKEPLPVGNVVGNPGFEVMAADDFPDGWQKYNWSGGKAYARKDKSNPREGGNYALYVRSVGGGSKPGVLTRVTLVPGKYEVSFHACTDEDETARVTVRLGDQDLKSATVGGEWKQITHEFDVTDKKRTVALGFYTTTANAKVWFDDVELKATGELEKPKEE